MIASPSGGFMKMIICTKTRTLDEVLLAIHPVVPRFKFDNYVVAVLEPAKIQELRQAGFKLWGDTSAHV
jgi:hypothetical protein